LTVWFIITFLYIIFWNIGTRVHEKTNCDFSAIIRDALIIIQVLGGAYFALMGIEIFSARVSLDNPTISGLAVLGLGLAILSFAGSEVNQKNLLKRIEDMKKK